MRQTEYVACCHSACRKIRKVGVTNGRGEESRVDVGGQCGWLVPHCVNQ